MRRALAVGMLAIPAAFLLGGQKGGVATVTVQPDSMTLQKGEIGRATCTPKNKFGAVLTNACTWTSRDTAVVKSSGSQSSSITARAVGSAWVVAVAGAGRDSVRVAVKDTATPPPPTGTCVGTLRTVNVTTASGLTTALGAALPGDCILLAAGTYSTGTIRQSRSGTAANPVTVRGAGASSIVTMGGGSWLPQAGFLHFRNFRLTSTFYGFYCGESGTAPGCPYAVFDSMEVDHAAQSGIALENGSSFAQVLRSKIHDTGTATAQYGEAVYVGGYGAATTDVQVRDNSMWANGAEAIDNSAGSDRMTATGNVIDGTGTAFINGATVSLVGLRGNNLVVNDNTLTNGDPHGIVIWQGSGSVLHRNVIHLYNIHNYPTQIGVQMKTGASALVSCDNTVDQLAVGGIAYSPACTP